MVSFSKLSENSVKKGRSADVLELGESTVFDSYLAVDVSSATDADKNRVFFRT